MKSIIASVAVASASVLAAAGGHPHSGAAAPRIVFQEDFTPETAPHWSLTNVRHGKNGYVSAFFQDGRLALQDFFWDDKPAVAESPTFEPCAFFRLSFDFRLHRAGKKTSDACSASLELLDEHGGVLAVLPWRFRGHAPGAELPGGVAIGEKTWYRIRLETGEDGRIDCRLGTEGAGEEKFLPSLLMLPDGARVARLRFKAVDGWDHMGVLDVAKLSVAALEGPVEDRPEVLTVLEEKAYRLSFRPDGGCDVFRREGEQLVWQAHLRAPVLPGVTGSVSYVEFNPKSRKEFFSHVNVEGIAGVAGIRETERRGVVLAAIGGDGAPKALCKWTGFAEAAKLDLFVLTPCGEQDRVSVFHAVGRPLLDKQVFAPVRTYRTNGEPEQETRAMMVAHGGAEGVGFVAATAAGLPVFAIGDEWRLPLKNHKTPWQPDRRRASLVLSFRSDARLARMEGEALASDEPIVADSRAGDAFFLVEQPGTVPVRTTLYNAFRLPQNMRVEYRAFDADGRRVAEGVRNVTAPSFGFAVAEFPVTLREAGPHWIEVDASTPYGADYQRICVGALKPVAFANDAGSRMGISAFRGTAGAAHPEARSDGELLGLMKRIGVRYLRSHGNCSAEARQMGFTLWYANQPGGQDWNRYWKGERTWMDDPKNRRAWLAGNLERTADLGAETFEFGNEWNLADGAENPTRAERYVKEWLGLLKEVRDADFPQIRLGGCVVANADLPYLKVVYDQGGWPLFDDLVFHMSGLPRAADNPGKEYWNVLRSLCDIRSALRQYGEKPLYLSEFYAPTAPNVLVSNNERGSAADLAIQIALAIAADVKGLMLYCLDDFDRVLPIKTAAELGEPSFRENYFGLVRRDWVPKATLWTFATAAELLDGARFVGDVDLPGAKHSFGLLFETPRGPVAFLWSRIDGYPQHEGSRPHAAHRPPWRSSVIRTEPVVLPGESVHVSDVFGRTHAVVGKEGRIRLELSSEPVFVQGLDLEAVNGYFSKMLK